MVTTILEGRNPDEGGCMFLRNVGNHLKDYTVLQPRRLKPIKQYTILHLTKFQWYLLWTKGRVSIPGLGKDFSLFLCSVYGILYPKRFLDYLTILFQLHKLYGL